MCDHSHACDKQPLLHFAKNPLSILAPLKQLLKDSGQNPDVLFKGIRLTEEDLSDPDFMIGEIETLMAIQNFVDEYEGDLGGLRGGEMSATRSDFDICAQKGMVVFHGKVPFSKNQAIRQFIIDWDMASLLGEKELFGNAKPIPEKVILGHNACGQVKAYEEWFQCTVIPSGTPSVRFKKQQLDQAFLQQVEEIHTEDEGPLMKIEMQKLQSDLIDNLWKLILSHEHHNPSICEAAEWLSMTPRTLQRRLLERDQKWRDFLNGIRCDHACQYLTQSTLTLSQIASRLGYGDTSNFSHAFSSWMGKAPGSYRQQELFQG